MEVREQVGLRVGYVDVAEALTTRWWERGRASEVDLIRVREPDPASWRNLEDSGFSVKPAWLTWLRRVPTSDEEFLQQLPKDAGRNFDRGRRYCASAPVGLELHFPADAAALDAFLDCYEHAVADMQRGVQFALSNRQLLRRQLATTSILLAVRDDRLVGGCLCQVHRGRSLLHIRYQVVARGERRNGLAWAIYLRAFQFARHVGLRVLSFGSDPNLYGHVSRTGLFYVKHRLGFRAVPSQLLGDGSDEADLLLSLASLADPALMVCYDLGRRAERIDVSGNAIEVPALRADLVHQRPAADLKMFQAGFLTGLRPRPVGAPRPADRL